MDFVWEVTTGVIFSSTFQGFSNVLKCVLIYNKNELLNE